jgi:hypothetical protein
MRPSVLSGFLAVLAFSLATPVDARAQWSVSAGLESDRFWGGSVERAPEQKSFRPYRPTVLHLGARRRVGSIGLGVSASYTEASLGLEGEEAVVAIKGAFKIVGISPEMTYHIATLGGNNRLLVHLGPLIEFWQPIEEEWRTRVGAQGAISLAVPLGGRFGLSVGGSLAVIASPLHTDELLEQYDLRSLWRRGFAAGLEYQL